MLYIYGCYLIIVSHLEDPDWAERWDIKVIKINKNLNFAVQESPSFYLCECVVFFPGALLPPSFFPRELYMQSPFLLKEEGGGVMQGNFKTTHTKTLWRAMRYWQLQLLVQVMQRKEK